MAASHFNTSFTDGPASAAVRVVLHTATLDSVLLVWTHANEAVSMSAVAAGGVAMTKLGEVSAGSSRSELWGLTTPAAGVLTISARLVGTQQAMWNIVATTYTGQRQIGGSPFGTVTMGTAVAANVALSVSAGANDLIAYGFGISANTTITTTTGNNRANTTHSTSGRLIVGDVSGPTQSVSATSGASGVWGMIAVPIIGASADAISTFTEDFEAALDSGKWTEANTNGTVTFTGGQGVLNITTEAANNQARIDSVQVLNLSADSVYVKIPTAMRVSSDAAGVNTVFRLTAANGDYCEWILNADGNLQVANGDNFVTTVLETITSAYWSNLSTYQWFRFKRSGTDFLYDRAPGSASNPPQESDWVNEHTIALASMPSTFANCQITFYCYMGTARTVIQPALIDALNTSVASGNFSATVAVTDKRDTVSIPSYAVIRGQAAVTDKRDTPAVLARARISGQTSVTDKPDTAAVTARARISGSVGVTDRKDTAAVSAYTLLRATVAVTDRRDSIAAAGYALISAVAAVTDRRDTVSIPAYIVGGTITGSVAVTDRRDTVAVAAQARITLNAAVTDKPDSIAVIGTSEAPYRTVAVNVTDRPDSPTIPAYAVIQGRIAATDARDSISVLANNVSESAAVVTTLIDGGSGGGGRKRKQRKPYVRLPDDFWEIREQHLRSLQPEMEESAEPAESVPTPTIAPVPPQLISYRIERASVIQKLQKAENPPKLYNHTKRLKQLNANIAEQKRQHLLALQAERTRLRLEKERRKRARARKLKKAIKLLAIARSLAALTYLYSKL